MKLPETLTFYALFYIWIMCIITFALFAYDKHQAYYSKYRVPEFILLLCSALGGSFGAGIAMWLFRHKTRKAKFYITVPTLVVITCLAGLIFTFPSSL